MEKGEEFLAPGYIWAPWTINLKSPKISDSFFRDNPYDIIFVKEFLRRRKIRTALAKTSINKDFYNIVGTKITETENEVIMDINVKPKLATQFIEMSMEILPSGGFFSIEK